MTARKTISGALGFLCAIFLMVGINQAINVYFEQISSLKHLTSNQESHSHGD